MSLLFLNTMDGRYNVGVAGLHLERRRVEKSRAEIVSKPRPLACANRLHGRMKGYLQTIYSFKTGMET